jgi:hypothetical protein
MDAGKNPNVSSLVSSRRLVLGPRCRRSSLQLDGDPTVVLKPLRFEVKAAKVTDVSWVRSATNEPNRNLRWRLVAGCTGLFLAMTIRIVYVTRVPEVIPSGTQTTRSICFVTSWQRTIHPSPFDELCRN